jgi:hypothetical protein
MVVAIHSREITMTVISLVSQFKNLNMKGVRSKLQKTAPKVHMGSGALPPRIAKELPKVHMGSGALPPRVAKELPKVHMGSGALPPRIATVMQKGH